MDKVRIFCEGFSDQRFLRDFISLNYQIEITDKQLKDNTIIHCLGGWTNLNNVKTKITEDFSEYTSLIFLDADDEETPEKAGIEQTRKYIDNLMQSWNWKKYDKYIFPNNEDQKGEVEDFLENIINPKNSDIFDCWNLFENCLSTKDKRFNVPAKKSKIYLYHESLHGNSSAEKNKCKDSGRDFKNKNLWDLEVDNNPYLKKLKNFLDQYLK
ncbi:MAG TPA: DUF3226 domain-containing protein [Flavobacterium sp.]